jgi:hypothetical protein
MSSGIVCVEHISVEVETGQNHVVLVVVEATSQKA